MNKGPELSLPESEATGSAPPANAVSREIQYPTLDQYLAQWTETLDSDLHDAVAGELGKTIRLYTRVSNVEVVEGRRVVRVTSCLLANVVIYDSAGVITGIKKNEYVDLTCRVASVDQFSAKQNSFNSLGVDLQLETLSLDAAYGTSPPNFDFRLN
jgi:hypothetical protein